MEFKLQSDSLKEFLPCWLEAQKELSKGLYKEKQAFNFKYATLEQMQEFGEPILNKQNLALNMARFPFEGNYYLMTKIFHVKSEQFIASYSFLYPLALTTVNQKAQGDLGGILSYQSRYDLRTILCLPCKCEDADDRTEEPEERPAKKEYVQLDGCITKQQSDMLFKATGFNVDLMKKVNAKCGVTFSSNIKAEDYLKALQYINDEMAGN